MPAPATAPTLPVPTRYLTVKQYCAAYPWPTARTLRFWIASARHNGANAWIRRIGRSVVLDVPALQAWIDEAGRADEPTPRPAPAPRPRRSGGAR